MRRDGSRPCDEKQALAVQERATPADIGRLTLEQLAAALSTVSTSSPSAASPSPGRLGQSLPCNDPQGQACAISWMPLCSQLRRSLSCSMLNAPLNFMSMRYLVH